MWVFFFYYCCFKGGSWLMGLDAVCDLCTADIRRGWCFVEYKGMWSDLQRGVHMLGQARRTTRTTCQRRWESLQGVTAASCQVGSQIKKGGRCREGACDDVRAGSGCRTCPQRWPPGWRRMQTRRSLEPCRSFCRPGFRKATLVTEVNKNNKRFTGNLVTHKKKQKNCRLAGTFVFVLFT